MSQKFLQGTPWIFWADIRSEGGGGEKTYIYMLEWCNLHEIPVNRERKPGGAVD